MTTTSASKQPRYRRSALILLSGIVLLGAIFSPVSIQPTQGKIVVSTASAVEASLGIPYFCGLAGLNPHRCTMADVSAECKADATKCTAWDKKALDVIQKCAADASITDFNGASYACTDEQAQQAAQAAQLYQATVTSCSSTWDKMTSPFTCMFRSFVTLTAGFLIYMSTWVLTFAGMLFNWLVDHTIVQFGDLYGTVKNAVETAWSAFRDIANITIIGIFTFIAISIILGLKEYGQKRMIANVLIIAVLINFSLLFAKIIIDGSNFTATQIYNAAGLSSGTGGATGASGTSATKGIAEQFMSLLGVSTFGNSFKLVDKTAEAKDSGWVALLHGLLVAAVLLGTAIVLFYGCFLLVSRMIMLIFLMVTASIAFASFLIPKWGKGSYGWDAWWSSLLWCASFGPILMFFLWMSLTVSYALKGGSKGTLGGALSDPSSGANFDALFMYVMVLGMLFATFKISSMWANKIGGFSMAAFLPALGVAGMGRLAGMIGRNTVGAGFGYASRRVTDLANQQKDAGRLRTGSVIQSLANQLEKPTKRDYNMMNTKFGKDISGIAGLKGAWAGETKHGGIEGTEKKAAEAYAKDAGKMAERAQKKLEENKDALLAEAARNIENMPENKEKKKLLKSMEETAKAELEQSKRTAEENRESHAAALKEATKQVKTAETQAESNKKAIEENSKAVIARLERDKEYTPEGSSARTEMENQIAAARADRDSRMNAEQANIDRAQAEATRVQGLIKADSDAITAATEKHKSASEEHEAFNKKIKSEAETVYAKRVGSVSTEKLAGKLAAARLTNIFGTDEDNDHLAALARKQAKESKEEKSIKQLISKQVEQAKKDAEPAAEESKPEAKS